MKLLIVVLLASTLSGVPKKSMDAAAYLEWYKSSDYPYRHTVIAGEMMYACTWVPYEVDLAREIVQKGLDRKTAKSRYKQKPTDLKFQLTIFLPKAGTDIFTYDLKADETSSTRTQYFSFAMKKDLHLKMAKGDLDCTAFMYERGIANYPVAYFDTYFPAARMQKESEVVYHDRIFSQQDIVFPIGNKAKLSLPKLHI